MTFMVLVLRASACEGATTGLLQKAIVCGMIFFFRWVVVYGILCTWLHMNHQVHGILLGDSQLFHMEVVFGSSSNRSKYARS